MEVLFAVIGVLIGVAIGFFVGMMYRKKVAEREIGSAEMEATRLINEAIRSGENRKKEMLLEAIILTLIDSGLSQVRLRAQASSISLIFI